MTELYSARRLLLLLAIMAAAACSSGTAPDKPAAATALVETGLPTLVRVGDVVHLSATAALVDGSLQNVTTSATWGTSNSAVGQISSTGDLTVVAPGSLTVTASYAGASDSHATTAQSALTGLACGVERWSVKTLSDPDASRVDMATVHSVTIRDLNQVPQHCSGIPDPRSFPEEFQLFEIVGQIVVAKLEDDHDYHIALADPSDPSQTIVTEIADPACQGAVDSPFRTLLTQARAEFDAMLAGRSLAALVGQTVRVRGIGFYDFDHGQTGRSNSCLEVHAVLAIVESGK